MRRWMLVLPLLMSATQVDAFERTVEVRAGKTHRKDTPVCVDIDAPKELVGSAGVAVSDGKAVPAQILQCPSGKARACWIVDDLPAGRTRTYTLKIGPGVCPSSTETFAWQDSSKDKTKSMDLRLGDRPVLRYMHTPFDRRDIELTKKPFHHVFSPDGSKLITKGAGGKYPHHRGIYFGYNKCKTDHGTFDVWHAHKGEHQVHVKTISETCGPVVGGHVVQIDWCDRKGKPFVRERRTLLTYRQSGGHLLIEFRSTLEPAAGPVDLNGDRQHAGAQFRASQTVAENEKGTRYLRPAKWAELKPEVQVNTDEHKDLPWNAVQYSLGDQGYTVAYLTDPKNPDGASFSERLYGRFGEFIPWQLSRDKPLTLRYRWWICGTRSVTREQVEERYRDLADPLEVTVK